MSLFGRVIGSAIKNAASKVATSKGSSSSKGTSGNKSFTNYNPNTDYTQEFRNAQNSGASSDILSGLYNQYNSKVQNPAYSKYDTPALRQYFESSIANAPSSGGGLQNNRNEYSDYLAEIESRNAEIQRQQEAAKRAAIEQGAARLEGNKVNINQGYDDTSRQAYIQKMQSQQSLPQMLAGQGISGGATESAQVALDASYGNNVASNERSRQNALTGVDSAISDLRSTGDISIAEGRLALQQQGMQDYQNAYAQKLQQENIMREFNQSKEMFDVQNYQSSIGAYGADYQAEINRLLASGVSKDDYRVKSLKAARQEKIMAQQAAAAAAQQQELENEMAWGKYQYQTSKPYYNPSSGKSSSKGTSDGGGGNYVPLV